MNNIDILEELKEWFNNFDLDSIKHKPEEYIQAISNLIAENKELKDSNVELATTIDCLQTDLKEIKEEYSAEQKYEMENTIPKSKVEEIIHNNKPHIAQEKLQSLLGKE